MSKKFQYWLVALDQYGNPTLKDGAHSSIKGVEKALYLHNRMGFAKGEKLAAAKIQIIEIEPSSKGVNEAAITILNSIGIKP